MKATILCYHKIGTLDQEGRRLNVAPENFGNHVRFLTRKKNGFLLAKDFISTPSQYSVCFTFDDAYRSTLQNAPEILERFGVRGSFYAVSSKIGNYSDWDGPDARPLADLELLKSALNSGHEIGNHSVSHRRLADLSEEEQRGEIIGCHERLSACGIHCSSFCYPYGSYRKETLEIVRKLGYRSGLSLRKGNVNGSEDPLELPRITVGFGDVLPKLIYKIQIRPALRKFGI